MASRSARRRQQAADEALIRSLIAEHGAALMAYATRLLGDRHAAEDVVQETLVRAWRNPDVLVNGKGSVRGWLLAVTRNLVIDRIRARAARPAEVAEVSEIGGAVPVEADPSDAVVNSMVVMDALDQLSEEHRKVLVQLYYGGSSVAEVADRLGIPPGTVRSRSYYALRALRQHIEPAAVFKEVS